MTSDSTTTLDAFHPTSIDDINEPSPKSVVELFEKISPWNTQIHVNDRGETYLVGRQLNSNPTTYEVYSQPESNAGTGVAGTISYKHQYDAPEEDRVGFQPTSENTEPSDENPVVAVEALQVDKHSRAEQLDAVLPLIRDTLTDSDWVVDPSELTDNELDLSKGRFLVSPDEIDDPTEEPWLPIRGDAGYGEWIHAVNRLADFRSENYENAAFALEPQTILRTRVMHGLVRYPLGANKLLSHIDEIVVEDNANPEALRTLLLDYAIEHVDLSSVNCLGA